MNRYWWPTLAILRRDLRLKYHSPSGFFWALVRPWLTVLVLQLVFTQVRGGNFGSFDLLSIFAGVVVWNFFVGAFADGGMSLVNNPTLFNRINFPFGSLPLASLGLFGLEALVHLLIWFTLMLLAGRLHLVGAFWGGLFLVHATILIGGLATIASVLNYRFKDIRFLWPMVLQIGFLLTPIGYPLELFAEKYSFLFHLNPLAGVIEGLRGVDIRDSVDLRFILSSWLWTLIIGVIATVTMKRYEFSGRT
jgi:lipopolysaccharide transport system permease protein